MYDGAEKKILRRELEQLRRQRAVVVVVVGGEGVHVDGYGHMGQCPVGAVLSPGDTVTWLSNDAGQGTQQSSPGCGQVECSCDKQEPPICGLPWSDFGLGGGWGICFDW